MFIFGSTLSLTLSSVTVNQDMFCKDKHKPTCKDMHARPEDIVLVLGSTSGSAWCVTLCCLFPSSGTCLCLSGSLHGLILLYGSNQTVLCLPGKSSSSGLFSFLASDLSSSAEMNHDTPGEEIQRFKSIQGFSFTVKQIYMQKHPKAHHLISSLTYLQGRSLRGFAWSFSAFVRPES